MKLQRDPDTGKVNRIDGKAVTDSNPTCCCGPAITYRQFKKCSDDSLADLWEPDAARGYPATVFSYADGLCYYIDSDHPTSTTPGTVMGGSATVTGCEDIACIPCSICAHEHPFISMTVTAGVGTTNFLCGNVGQWTLNFPGSWSASLDIPFFGETAPGVCVWALDADCGTFAATLTDVNTSTVCPCPRIQITIARFDNGGGTYAWEIGAIISWSSEDLFNCFGESPDLSCDGCCDWSLFSASSSDSDTTCDEDVIIPGDPIDHSGIHDGNGPNGGGSVTLELASPGLFASGSMKLRAKRGGCRGCRRRKAEDKP